MPEDMIELNCPVSSCPFFIRISKETGWKKVFNAFCQHLLENHSPQCLVETIYKFVAAEVGAKNPSFFGVQFDRGNAIINAWNHREEVCEESSKETVNADHPRNRNQEALWTLEKLGSDG